jgi:dienelactone hydrolase
MSQRLAVAAAFAFACLLSNGALAQEKVSIPSFTPASPAAYLKHDGPAVTLTGSLYLPAGTTGKIPALILKHGSGGLEGGPGDNIRDWAARIAGWGVAALVLDSFAPRKITETATSQSQLAPWAEVADSYAALKFLAADARIDRTRIGIMGWSRGGLITMNTTLEAARKAGGVGDDKFAVHIVFYGSAMTQYRDAATDKSPFLFFHGEADNYVPIGPTREYADWLKTMGNPVTFVSYPGAYHDFDIAGGFQGFTPTVEVSAKCDNVINLTDQRILRMDHKPNPMLKPGEFEAYQKSCATKGANLGYDPKARADAVDKVHAFLKETLKAPG